MPEINKIIYQSLFITINYTILPNWLIETAKIYRKALLKSFI